MTTDKTALEELNQTSHIVIGGQNIPIIMEQTTMSKRDSEINECLSHEPIRFKNHGMEDGNIYKASYDVKLMSARAKRRREARNTRRRY